MRRCHVAVRVLPLVLAALFAAGCSGPVPRLTTEQKLQDFDFLLETFRDNHPFLFLKSRVEDYDWLALEAEFREAVRQTKNNVKFATAIRRVVGLVGNAHTRVVDGRHVSAAGGLSGLWSEASAQTTAEIADYWAQLGVPRQNTWVLHAVYSGGEYYVCKTTISVLAAGQTSLQSFAPTSSRGSCQLSLLRDREFRGVRQDLGLRDAGRRVHWR